MVMRSSAGAARGLVVVALLVGLAGVNGFGAGLRSIGIRAVLPLGGVPPLLGIEASIDASFGVAGATLFLSSAGHTLITLNADIRLAGGTEGTGTYVRLCTGLFYFDSTRALPSLLAGAGLAWEIRPGSHVGLSVAGEFLYPIAFPAPLFTVSGRWLPG